LESQKSQSKECTFTPNINPVFKDGINDESYENIFSLKREAGFLITLIYRKVAPDGRFYEGKKGIADQ
jgi:hypothetical protein